MNTPVFLHLSMEKLQTFIDNSSYKLQSYAPRDFVAMQNDPCRAFYLLYDGKVRASMIGPDGKRVTIEDHQGPVLLAPNFVFATNNRFPVDVVALTPCEVLIISKEHFIEFMRREPIVMYNFLRILSDRSRLLTQKLGAFALLGLKSRVATYLCEHGDIHNQQDVAERLGVARPSLSRILAELAKEGCVAFANRKIIIADRSLLEKYL